mgnify:CR=1 FL=1
MQKLYKIIQDELKTEKANNALNTIKEIISVLNENIRDDDYEIIENIFKNFELESFENTFETFEKVICKEKSMKILETDLISTFIQSDTKYLRLSFQCSGLGLDKNYGNNNFIQILDRILITIYRRTIYCS